jgi:hypothetical protein
MESSEASFSLLEANPALLSLLSSTRSQRCANMEAIVAAQMADPSALMSTGSWQRSGRKRPVGDLRCAHPPKSTQLPSAPSDVARGKRQRTEAASIDVHQRAAALRRLRLCPAVDASLFDVAFIAEMGLALIPEKRWHLIAAVTSQAQHLTRTVESIITSELES